MKIILLQDKRLNTNMVSRYTIFRITTDMLTLAPTRLPPPRGQPIGIALLPSHPPHSPTPGCPGREGKRRRNGGREREGEGEGGREREDRDKRETIRDPEATTNQDMLPVILDGVCLLVTFGASSLAKMFINSLSPSSLRKTPSLASQ